MGAPKETRPTRLILGSASPRRKALLEAMGYSFKVLAQNGEEDYPTHLKHAEITDYLSILKASHLKNNLDSNTLLLTADTIVWQDGHVLGKPGNRSEAVSTLEQLSDAWHEVITSVCFTTAFSQRVGHAVTRVRFAKLDPAMIETYLRLGHPLDKAGAYGIQEWIGLAGVEAIEGSYTNVVGLPTRLVYETLSELGICPI